ncbi:complement factor H isoform X2 [Gracilinanus agilis]|uniref:complement factor H isoform X2 n=1 Tax=Gracilinanus agilis TaxID=191870 RepID=UPI001CFE4CCA|nr:complement factor H isoform X2 [Gracilinanus agilis]
MRFPVKIALLLLWNICAAQDCNEAPPRKATELLTGTWSGSVYAEGTRAIYKCRPGYRTLGTIVLECKNGEWKSLYPHRICMRKPCGHPGDIQFGSFELLEETEFLFGAKVVYKCNEGYQLVSPFNFRVCEADGWSNDVPFCEVIKCSAVTAPENGRIVTSSLDLDQEFTFGQVIQFSCNPGFALKGERKIHCSTDGDWSAQEPTCIEIICQRPNIQNGNLLSIRKPSYKDNERIQYNCDLGYMPSERGDAICTESGWTPEISCREVTCEPPILTNGNVNNLREKYRGNEEISYSCKTGFYPPLTGNKATCTSEGWSPLPRCNWKPCEYPEIENGHLYKPYYQSEEYFRRSFPASIGRELDYHCDDHFVPAHGTNSYHSYWTRFICTEEGWSPVPKCIRQCSIRSIPYGQFLPRKETFKEGEVITVKCHQSYSLQNNQNKITCTRKGWSIDPYCKKIKTCTVFRLNLKNGFFSDSIPHYPVNRNASYQCKEGYGTINGKKEGFITCGQNGWLSQPTCMKICDIPSFVNAKQKGKKTFLKPKEKLEYECMDGYEIGSGQTKGFKICQDDEWPTVIECYEKACSLPILHGMEPDLKKAKYKVDDVLTFRCNSGLKIEGPSSVQCYHFGWSPRLPTCKKEVNCCVQPPEILNGTAKYSKKEKYCHGDEVEYDCDLGFVRTGPRKIKCNDGEWTTLPTCNEEKRRCAEVPELVHGFVHTPNILYSHGSSVEYGCVENFIMIGKNTSICIHGNWTQPPICIEQDRFGKCKSKNFEDFQVNLTNAFNDIVVNYKCNWNSEFKSTKCKNGRWSPPPSCPTMKSCAPPPQIPNSQDMDITVNYEDGEKIAIICKENYLLQGQEEIICKNGHWNSLPRCIEKQPCSKPPAIQYGYINPVNTSEEDKDNLEPNTYAHDTIVSYQCQQGFMIIGEEEIKCNMGKWSSPPHCIGIPCREPPQIHNGNLPKVSERYEFGEEVTYTCKEGYNIDGLATITCNGGTWSSPPQCKDHSCEYAPHIENAEIITNIKDRYEPGEVVSYRCTGSLKLYGKSDVTCNNKTWTDLPECKEEVGKCGPPPPINNGDTATFPLSEYAPESRVQYICQKFYVLQGSQFVTCKNGKWTDPPTCLEACTVSEEIMKRNNIQLRWKNTEKIYSRTGQKTEFYCIWGYRRAEGSPPFRATCVEGKINYPICV